MYEHGHRTSVVTNYFYRATLCVSAVFVVARCLPVRLSVCDVGASYPNGWRYRQTSLSARQLHYSSFLAPGPVPNSKGNLQRGRKIEVGGKILRFLSEIAVYLRNDDIDYSQKFKIPKILYQKVIVIRLQCLCYSGDIALVLNNY